MNLRDTLVSDLCKKLGQELHSPLSFLTHSNKAMLAFFLPKCPGNSLLVSCPVALCLVHHEAAQYRIFIYGPAGEVSAWLPH